MEPKSPSTRRVAPPDDDFDALPGFPTIAPEEDRAPSSPEIPADETDPALFDRVSAAPPTVRRDPTRSPPPRSVREPRSLRDTPAPASVRSRRASEPDEDAPVSRRAWTRNDGPRSEISRPLSTRGSVPPPPVSRRSDPGRGGLSEPIKPAIPAQLAREVSSGENDARVARAQMGVALVVGLLVAMSLYVWRRPRTETPPAPSESASQASSSAAPVRDLATTPVTVGNPSAVAAANAPGAKVAVSEARTIGCASVGKKLSDEGCERLPEVEKALVAAIQSSGTCLGGTRGGTIEYQADIHFEGRKVSVVAPRSGRTVQGTKAVTTCALAVKRALAETVPWEAPNRKHEHLRLAVVASY